MMKYKEFKESCCAALLMCVRLEPELRQLSAVNVHVHA